MRWIAAAVASMVLAVVFVGQVAGSDRVSPGSARVSAACAQWDVAGTWETAQANAFSIAWQFSQSGTSISGSAILPAAEATRAGYTGTVGQVKGTLVGDHLDVVVVWPPKTDGSGSSGEYAGTVVATTPGRGELKDGQAWDRANPSARIVWSGSGPAQCVNGANPSPPSSSQSGTLSGIQGTTVEVQHGGGGWTPAADGGTLKPGDSIHTGWKSRVVITIGGHNVTLEPMTLLQIQQIGPSGQIAFLKLGEVKANPYRKTGSAADFNVKTPTDTASDRGTVFSVLYDGATSIVSVTQGSVDVKPNSGPAVTVTAGHEVASTASSAGPLLPIGKAGAPPGSVGPGKALSLLTAALAKGFAACRVDAYSTVLKPTKNGWRATLKILGAKKGTATWTISGLKVAPTNALAKKIAAGCR